MILEDTDDMPPVALRHVVELTFLVRDRLLGGGNAQIQCTRWPDVPLPMTPGPRAWLGRGPLPPEFDIADDWTPEFCDGCYYPAYAQRIQVDDVSALVQALEHALPDIPDIDTGSPPTGTAYWAERDGPVTNLITELGGRNKVGVTEFIAHCREGGEIWIC